MTLPSVPAVVERATVAASEVTFVPLESLSCTVIVDVEVPSAVMDDVPAVMVEVDVEGPLTVKVTDPVVALRYDESAAFVAEIVHVPPEV